MIASLRQVSQPNGSYVTVGDGEYPLVSLAARHSVMTECHLPGNACVASVVGLCGWSLLLWNLSLYRSVFAKKERDVAQR